MHALAFPDALAPPAPLVLLLAALFCAAFLNPLRACLALFLVRPDEQGCGLSIPEDQTRLSPPPPYRHPPRMGEGMRCFVHHTPPNPTAMALLLHAQTHTLAPPIRLLRCSARWAAAGRCGAATHVPHVPHVPHACQNQTDWNLHLTHHHLPSTPTPLAHRLV